MKVLDLQAGVFLPQSFTAISTTWVDFVCLSQQAERCPFVPGD